MTLWIFEQIRADLTGCNYLCGFSYRLEAVGNSSAAVNAASSLPLSSLVSPSSVLSCLFVLFLHIYFSLLLVLVVSSHFYFGEHFPCVFRSFALSIFDCLLSPHWSHLHLVSHFGICSICLPPPVIILSVFFSCVCACVLYFVSFLCKCSYLCFVRLWVFFHSWIQSKPLSSLLAITSYFQTVNKLYFFFATPASYVLLFDMTWTLKSKNWTGHSLSIEPHSTAVLWEGRQNDLNISAKICFLSVIRVFANVSKLCMYSKLLISVW